MARGPAGFEEFVGARARAMQRTAYLLTGDWATAQDLVQVALVKTWPRWERIARRDDPEVYVRRVMVNTYVTWWRRRWRGELPTGRVPDRVEVGDLAGEAATRLAVREALARLTRRERVMVVLRVFDDLTEDQVAGILGCAVGTVKSTTARALGKLRRDPQVAALAREATS